MPVNTLGHDVIHIQTYVKSLLSDQVRVQIVLSLVGITVSPYNKFGRDRATDIIHTVSITERTWRLDILGRSGYIIAIYLKIKKEIYKIRGAFNPLLPNGLFYLFLWKGPCLMKGVSLCCYYYIL